MVQKNRVQGLKLINNSLQFCQNFENVIHCALVITPSNSSQILFLTHPTCCSFVAFCQTVVRLLEATILEETNFPSLWFCKYFLIHCECIYAANLLCTRKQCFLVVIYLLCLMFFLPFHNDTQILDRGRSVYMFNSGLIILQSLIVCTLAGSSVCCSPSPNNQSVGIMRSHQKLH